MHYLNLLTIICVVGSTAGSKGECVIGSTREHCYIDLPDIEDGAIHISVVVTKLKPFTLQLLTNVVETEDDIIITYTLNNLSINSGPRRNQTVYDTAVQNDKHETVKIQISSTEIRINREGGYLFQLNPPRIIKQLLVQDINIDMLSDCHIGHVDQTNSDSHEDTRTEHSTYKYEVTTMRDSNNITVFAPNCTCNYTDCGFCSSTSRVICVIYICNCTSITGEQVTMFNCSCDPTDCLSVYEYYTGLSYGHGVGDNSGFQKTTQMSGRPYVTSKGDDGKDTWYGSETRQMGHNWTTETPVNSSSNAGLGNNTSGDSGSWSNGAGDNEAGADGVENSTLRNSGSWSNGAGEDGTGNSGTGNSGMGNSETGSSGTGNNATGNSEWNNGTETSRSLSNGTADNEPEITESEHSGYRTTKSTNGGNGNRPTGIEPYGPTNGYSTQNITDRMSTESVQYNSDLTVAPMIILLMSLTIISVVVLAIGCCCVIAGFFKPKNKVEQAPPPPPTLGLGPPKILK
ncbi:uncharacterized protein [Antedon mediterranea]|uniref:uncharacterized protein n=1 Tax=Antedon mediterranea TaxID=105859 RepID=UPI003AF7D66C